MRSFAPVRFLCLWALLGSVLSQAAPTGHWGWAPPTYTGCPARLVVAETELVILRATAMGLYPVLDAHPLSIFIFEPALNLEDPKSPHFEIRVSNVHVKKILEAYAKRLSIPVQFVYRERVFSQGRPKEFEASDKDYLAKIKWAIELLLEDEDGFEEAVPGRTFEIYVTHEADVDRMREIIHGFPGNFEFVVLKSRELPPTRKKLKRSTSRVEAVNVGEPIKDMLVRIPPLSTQLRRALNHPPNARSKITVSVQFAPHTLQVQVDPKTGQFSAVVTRVNSMTEDEFELYRGFFEGRAKSGRVKIQNPRYLRYERDLGTGIVEVVGTPAALQKLFDQYHIGIFAVALPGEQVIAPSED